MSGFPGQYGAPPTTWQEHRTPDGRAYYYNPATKVTQWTKPEEMMAPEERALAAQPWKEYTAEGGRKYWYNTETKQSSWEMPDAFKKASSAASPAPAAASFPQVGPGAFDGGREADSRDYRESRDGRDHRERDRDRDRDRERDRDRDRDRERDRDRDRYEPRAANFVPSTVDPEYATPEEAEQAFMKLLRRSGVQSNWGWPETIRATAKDPQFRAIRDARERRAAFEKYCQDMVAQDKERAEERLAKLRSDFETMLKRHPEITHYTRWKTARPIIEGETIFRSTNNDEERRQLFEEYVANLKKAHAEQKASVHKSAMDGLIDLLPKLNLEAYTRWSDAQGLISSTAPFQAEEKYRSLTQFDILTAFQTHMKSLERAFNDAKQEKKTQKFRKERKARDAFKTLLESLRKEGKLKVGTTWSQIYPLIQNDERYKAVAGNAGSTAQDMLWDIVEEEERGLRGPRNDVLDVLEDKRFEITPNSELQEFMSVIKEDRRTANIDEDILKLLFDRLRDKRSGSRRDEDRQTERQQRHALDDLRSFLKRVEPPITAQDTYEKVRPQLLKADEFQAVSSEDARRSAFDRHLRRLRDRDDDYERGHRREDRMSIDRDGSRRERDRSRGDRSHRGGGRSGRRSRSPEADPYEADRRRAIAERERTHRKATMGDRDRERDLDRPMRSARDDDLPYDRDQRSRRRPDRTTYDELPYGDERPPSGSRRRRDDTDDYARRDSRDSKRARKDRSRERTPPRDATRMETSPPPKDVMSGSEEGEIEE